MNKSQLDLQSFVRTLETEREIVTIDVQVDPFLEAAEIHRRVIEEEGPALLFKNIKGSSFPVVTNLFGTRRRVEMAFGNNGSDFFKDIASLPQELIAPDLGTLWEKRSTISKILSVGIKRSSFVSKNWMNDTQPDLNSLPLLTTWKEDGGPFITLGLVYTEHPETAIHNLGLYRMQRFDTSTTGLHMQIGKGGGFHLARAKELGRNLPVNVFLGGPPALILSAIAPLPENVGELLLASLLLGQKLRMAKSPYSELPIVETAEFILSGFSNPNELRPEGPFGDHYGYYSLTHDFPVFHCTSMLRRKNAILPATVVGKPRQEDFYLGDFIQELFLPIIPLVMPGVRDLWSYGETGYHSLAAAVVRERYKREAMVSAFRILGEGQLSLTKFLLAVDKPQNLRDFRSVLTYILERADFRTDLHIFSNLSMDTLDYTGPKLNEGSKGVLLGMGEPIRKLPEFFSGELPGGVSQCKMFSPGCLVVSGPEFSADPKFAENLATADQLKDWPLIVLVDDAQKAGRSEASFLWTTFTRFEPAQDMFGKSVTLHRFHPSVEAPLVIDARMKGSYPDELFCDEVTEMLVNSRWKEYFPSTKIRKF